MSKTSMMTMAITKTHYKTEEEAANAAIERTMAILSKSPDGSEYLVTLNQVKGQRDIFAWTVTVNVERIVPEKPIEDMTQEERLEVLFELGQKYGEQFKGAFGLMSEIFHELANDLQTAFKILTESFPKEMDEALEKQEKKTDD